MIGAHPDDCEYDAGGTAALWAQSGFKVKFLAATNGELLPTLENRRVLTRKIREWRADVVVAHRLPPRPPLHRYSGPAAERNRRVVLRYAEAMKRADYRDMARDDNGADPAK